MFEIIDSKFNNSKKTEIKISCKIPIMVANSERVDAKSNLHDYYYDVFILYKEKDRLDLKLIPFKIKDFNYIDIILNSIRKKYKLDPQCRIAYDCSEYKNTEADMNMELIDCITIIGDNMTGYMRQLKIGNVLKNV